MNSENVVAFDFLQLEVNGIFNSGEFGQISDKPLKVGNILHKATIDVNTEGTEAAAATGVFTFPVDSIQYFGLPHAGQQEFAGFGQP